MLILSHVGTREWGWALTSCPLWVQRQWSCCLWPLWVGVRVLYPLHTEQWNFPKPTYRQWSVCFSPLQIKSLSPVYVSSSRINTRAIALKAGISQRCYFFLHCAVVPWRSSIIHSIPSVLFNLTQLSLYSPAPFSPSVKSSVTQSVKSYQICRGQSQKVAYDLMYDLLVLTELSGPLTKSQTKCSINLYQ